MTSSQCDILVFMRDVYALYDMHDLPAMYDMRSMCMNHVVCCGLGESTDGRALGNPSASSDTQAGLKCPGPQGVRMKPSAAQAHRPAYPCRICHGTNTDQRLHRTLLRPRRRNPGNPSTISFQCMQAIEQFRPRIQCIKGSELVIPCLLKHI